MVVATLKNLYLSYTGQSAEEIVELPSSGSNRRYFRLNGVKTLIGVSGTSPEEDRAFIYMSHHFLGKSLPVPEVFCSSDDFRYYLQEDLGDTLLFNTFHFMGFELFQILFPESDRSGFSGKSARR